MLRKLSIVKIIQILKEEERFKCYKKMLSKSINKMLWHSEKEKIPQFYMIKKSNYFIFHQINGCLVALKKQIKIEKIINLNLVITQLMKLRLYLKLVINIKNIKSIFIQMIQYTLHVKIKI